MNRIMLALLLASGVTGLMMGQNNSIEVYPWNPDVNNDNAIGAPDLLSTLAVYGNEFGLLPEPCTYDGTPLEELVAGITDGTIILDSIFVEYELEDVSTYYMVGCPDPITDTLVFSNTALLTSFSMQLGWWGISGLGSFGDFHNFRFYNDNVTGLYQFMIQSNTVGSLGFNNDGFFGYIYSRTSQQPFPFPTNWHLDESGIHLDEEWNEEHWAYYANYLHILPYWHYAE